MTLKSLANANIIKYCADARNNYTKSSN